MKYSLLFFVTLLFSNVSFAQANSQLHPIITDKAPKPIGTYSQAIAINNLLFISGQIGISPASNQLLPDFKDQTHQAFKNIQAICHASGSNLNQIVKLTIFLTDLSLFPEVNKIMAQYFKEPYPSRVTVQVAKLPKDAKIEIDAISAISDKG